MYRYYGIYRNGLIFRKPPSTGEDEGGGLVYELDAREGVTVRFYDASTDDYLGEIRAEAGEFFLGCQFEITRRGPGNASISLSGLPSYVQVGVRMDIHVYPWGAAWYSGRVVAYEMPVGSPVTVSAASLLQDLAHRIWTESYTSKSIEYIVDDIITTLESDISLVYDADLIEATGYTAGGDNPVEFDHEPVFSALETLEKLSQVFVFGYRASDRKFYFTKDRYATLLHLWEGMNCGPVNVTVDASELVNRAYVRLGEVDALGNSFSASTVDDADSQGEYGLREKVLSVGNLDETDALEYARYYVDQYKDPKVSISIPHLPLWLWETAAPTALGFVRVTKGLVDDTLVPQPLVAEWLLDDGMSDYTTNWTGADAVSSDGATYVTGAGGDAYVKIASACEFPFSLKATVKANITSGYAEIRLGDGSKQFILEVYGNRVEPGAGSGSYSATMTAYQTLMICCHDADTASAYHLVSGVWVNTGLVLNSEVSANDELWLGVAAASAGILHMDQVSYIGQDLGSQIQIQPEGIESAPVYSLPIERITFTVEAANLGASIEAGAKQISISDAILGILRRMDDKDAADDSRFKDVGAA